MLRRLWEKRSWELDAAALAAVALALRLWGIRFDLPNSYHPDEYVYVEIALKVLKSGDYNPHFFQYPSLFFYFLAAAYIPYFLWSASRGLLSTVNGLALPIELVPRDVIVATMPTAFLVGRFMSSLFATATVVLVYVIGRRLYRRRVGLFAGLLLAVAFTHVRISHFVTPDGIMTFFVTLAVLLNYNVLTNGRLRDYVLGGVAIGLAATTKYNAGAAILLLLAAHALREGKSGFVDTKLVAGILCCCAAFLAGSPYIILDLPGFLNGLAFEMRHYGLIGEPDQTGSTLMWYLVYLWKYESPIALLAAVQAVRSLFLRSRKALYLTIFPVLYFCLISTYRVRNDRSLAPILPLASLLAALLVNDVAEVLRRRLPHVPRQWVRASLTALVFGLCAAIPVWGTVNLDRAFSRPDVRTVAAEWVERNLPPGSRIAIESYSPLMAKSVHHLELVGWASDHPLDWYRQNADYLFLHSRGHFGAIAGDPASHALQIARYQDIFQQFSLIREFQGPSLGFPCWVRVYEVR